MSGHEGGDPVKVIRAALYANLAIALCKFVAAYLSHSTSTLAEAVHSFADTGNQALLFVGVRLAAKDDPRFMFGRAAERYFWPFLVALLLFSVGGLFAIHEGVTRALAPEAPDLTDFWSLRHGPLTSLVVLGVSTGLEGFSCTVALGEFRKGAHGKPFFQAILSGKDPTIPLVLMEDISALCGLSIALVAVVLTVVTRNGIFDAIGSIVIGVLLTAVAALIAKKTHSLLIGERALPESERRARELAEGTPGVLRVTQLLTMHLGPDFVILAIKVAFDPKLELAAIEACINELERRIRGELPEMKKIFVEPDSAGDRRGLGAEPDAPAPS
ncbi:MAG TPA: cation diffusion facilitator family transporter [Byssovorax sp.]|jgi:cation diffusion facilitator family transporter